MWDRPASFCSSVGVSTGSDKQNRGGDVASAGMVDLEPAEQSCVWRQAPRTGLVEQACS